MNTKYMSKKRYSINSKSMINISFEGSRMNYFRIANNSNTSLYVGTATTPTKSSYDFRVPPNTNKMYCEDRLYSNIMIYNDGTETANVMVYAFVAEFDPVVVALCDEFDDAETSAGTVNVEISGFTQPLPTGNNKIGNVGIIESLPAGTNNIGKVTLADLNTLTAKMTDIINAMPTSTGGGGSSIDYNTKLDSVIAKMTELYNDTHYLGLLAESKLCNIFSSGTNGATIENINYINVLSNDGDTDFTFSTSKGHSFTLKSGEVLNDMSFTDNVTLTIPTGATYRLIGAPLITL